MDRKRKICVWIIIIGLGNFIAFTMMYIILGGDAKNGMVRQIDGKRRYLIQTRGSEAKAVDSGKPPRLPTCRPDDEKVQFVRIGATNIYKTLDGTAYKDIGRGMYVYSGVHSIIILLTVAAVLLAMLTLAKDHIDTTLENQIISGRALVHVFATVVVLTTMMMTVWFVMDFVKQLRH